MLPPTSSLPPIKRIGTTPNHELRQSIDYIKTIYNPPVRGSRRRRNTSRDGLNGSSSSNASSSPGDAAQETLDNLRSDPFERNYVIRWLTTLVSHFSSRENQDDDSESDRDVDTSRPSSSSSVTNASPSSSPNASEALLADTAALLALCAGTASAGIISRVFTASSPYGPLSIQLRDVPLDNQDYGSVGAQTWGGACVMAEMVVEDAGRFGLDIPRGGVDDETEVGVDGDETKGREQKKPFRILELGAGTGLVSLAIASLFRKKFENQRGKGGQEATKVEIVATDYYPSVLENLQVNLANNGFGSSSFSSSSSSSPSTTTTSSSSSVQLQSHPLDWSTFPSQTQPPAPLDEPFDMAFGADIVYEEKHAIWIKACLDRLLKQPCKDGGGHFFHLIIPLRSTHTFESGTIETVFGRPRATEAGILVTPSVEAEAGAGAGGARKRGLVILEKKCVTCEEDGGDEVAYAYYRIGWCY